MPHSAVSDLGLPGLPMSHKKDAMLIWVNFNTEDSSLFGDKLICTHFMLNMERD